MTELELIQKIYDTARQETISDHFPNNQYMDEYFRGMYEMSLEFIDIIQNSAKVCGQCKKVLDMGQSEDREFCSDLCENKWLEGN